MNEDGTNAAEPYFDIKGHVIVARICYTLQDEDRGLSTAVKREKC